MIQLSIVSLFESLILFSKGGGNDKYRYGIDSFDNIFEKTFNLLVKIKLEISLVSRNRGF